MGCFYLAGQVCTAAERVLVHRDVHDAFVERLVERTKQLRVGDPLTEDTDMGPMCHRGHARAHPGAHRGGRRERRPGGARGHEQRDVPRRRPSSWAS